MTPQSKTVLRHMINAGSISNVEANAVHRVRSLSRRITEIDDALWSATVAAKNAEIVNYPVRKEFKRDVTGQRYVRYSLNPRVVAYAKAIVEGK